MKMVTEEPAEWPATVERKKLGIMRRLWTTKEAEPYMNIDEDGSDEPEITEVKSTEVPMEQDDEDRGEDEEEESEEETQSNLVLESEMECIAPEAHSSFENLCPAVDLCSTEALPDFIQKPEKQLDDALLSSAPPLPASGGKPLFRRRRASGRNLQSQAGCSSLHHSCASRGAPWCLKRQGRFACDGSTPSAELNAPLGKSAKRPRLGMDALVPQFQALAESVQAAVQLMKQQMAMAMEEALIRQRKDEQPCTPGRQARLGGC